MTRVVGFVCGFPTSMSQAWAELVRAGSVCSCSSGLQRLAVATRRAVRCDAGSGVQHAACSSSGQRSPCTLRAPLWCRAVPIAVVDALVAVARRDTPSYAKVAALLSAGVESRPAAAATAAPAGAAAAPATTPSVRGVQSAACSVQPPHSHGGALTKINNGGAHTSTEPGVGWGRRKHRHRCSFSRDSEP